MKILTTTTDVQVFKVIPRKESDTHILRLISKDTNEEIVVNATYIYDGIYLEISASFSLADRTTYSLILEDENNTLLYRDMVFCTDQSEYMKYNPSSIDYVERGSSNNEYVVL